MHYGLSVFHNKFNMDDAKDIMTEHVSKFEDFKDPELIDFVAPPKPGKTFIDHLDEGMLPEPQMTPEERALIDREVRDMDFADEAVIKWSSKNPREKADTFGNILWGELKQMEWAEPGKQFDLKGEIDPVEVQAVTLEEMIKKTQAELADTKSINIATMKELTEF